MEDYVYHLGPGPAKVLGAHMLEVCPSIAAERPSCEIHPLSIGGREDPVRLVFSAPPGPAMTVCLIDVGGRLRMVANEVDVVVPDEELPALPVARAVWEPRPDLVDGRRGMADGRWLAPQRVHEALRLEALRDLAGIAGVELHRRTFTATGTGTLVEEQVEGDRGVFGRLAPRWVLRRRVLRAMRAHLDCYAAVAARRAQSVVQVVGAAWCARAGCWSPSGRAVRSTGAGVTGGKVEPGEPDLAALVRELREELGVDVVPQTFLGEVGPRRAGRRRRARCLHDAALVVRVDRRGTGRARAR